VLGAQRPGEGFVGFSRRKVRIEKSERVPRSQLSGLRVARVMSIHAFREKPFPAALTAPRERGASTFCPHARTETVLTFAGTLRSL
jgi:hypothetical protein